MIGLEAGSYEAYCFDEALWYLGAVIEDKLDKASHKPSKEERRAHAARQRVLDKLFGKADDPKKFADPALLFDS